MKKPFSRFSWKRKCNIIIGACLLLAVSFVVWFLAGNRVFSEMIPEESENAYAFIDHFFSERNSLDLQTRRQEFTKILEYTSLHCPDRGPPRSRLFPSFLSTPNFFEIVKNTRVFEVMALFDLCLGRREEALEQIVSACYLTRLMGKSNASNVQYFGHILCLNALKQLHFYLSNACETTEDVDVFFQSLRKLTISFDGMTTKDSYLKEFGTVYSLRNWKQICGFIDNGEARRNIARINLSLLEVAAAAKRRFLAEGEFPASEEELVSAYQITLPEDPFGKGQIKFLTRREGGEFVCYSIGPDGVDDGGEIEYDSEIGVFSAGDILLAISTTRKYPFPRRGIKANSPAEVRSFFPNGLPPDIFSNTKTTPLGITNTTPVYIFSFGPDRDETREERPLSENHATEVMFDPTNGVMSNGDLFIEIPMK